MKLLKTFITTVIFSLSAVVFAANPMVMMETSHGNIQIELYPERAPISVKNFLQYVNDGFYNEMIFHRVIPHFMIQAGGFHKSLVRKATRSPIVNEADNGLSNTRGTLSMARTSSVNSATSQFFINSVDNLFLDHKSKSPSKFGYAVFGKVTDESLKVVDAISNVKTAPKAGHQNMPVENVEIYKMYEIKDN